MNRAALIADAAAVLVSLLVLCCAMPVQAGCEAPKPKPRTVYKPKPQQVCTCKPMQQARKVVKRAAVVVNRQLTNEPAQPVCPEPAPSTASAASAAGGGGGGGLRAVPFNMAPEPPMLPAFIAPALPIQLAPLVVQADAPSPVLFAAGPTFAAIAAPIFAGPLLVMPVVTPAVPEPPPWSLLALGGIFIFIFRSIRHAAR